MGATNFGLKFKKFVWCLGRGSRFQGKAKSEMLDKVRAENTHLSADDLNAKLCEALDAYVRQVLKPYK